MTELLKGRTIIITGATGGIGSACARRFVAEGAELMLVDRDPARLAALAGELGNDPLTMAADVTSENDMNAMAAATVERFGKIDALIASAGILRTSGQPTQMVDTTFEEFRTIVDVNLTGTFLSNKAVLPAMLERGEGDIINVSSVSGVKGRAFDAAYSASKFGVVGLSESLAEEVGRRGVRVQTLLPDAVETPIWDQLGGAALRPKTMLPPERIADCALWLIALPRDMFIVNPVIAPVQQRRKKGKAAAPAAATEEAKA
ncbi:NAD(P)-dependent oxidoreductase [Acuticoccus sediminis]|uniref:NAD(P)-dependent oxidoreductase n=1 Tax=Acuticoccus sediminis TaxID=2184697 RepID=A0A8B2NY74_9HYPH|nr:SDR family oxidoreductase [Acuticoccus sediminis]RAI03085.1 NAD(P)-dependent oxidoreductase [Acuticoccus sediminis]